MAYQRRLGLPHRRAQDDRRPWLAALTVVVEEAVRKADTMLTWRYPNVDKETMTSLPLGDRGRDLAFVVDSKEGDCAEIAQRAGQGRARPTWRSIAIARIDREVYATLAADEAGADAARNAKVSNCESVFQI